MMTIDTRQFDIDIRKFADNIGVDIALVAKKIAIDVFTDLINTTPVDTGRARSNWIISIGDSSLLELPTSGALKSAAETQIGHGTAILGTYNGQQVIYITNGLPYIERLNEGWSHQAPAGFVEAAIAKNVKPIADAQR